MIAATPWPDQLSAWMAVAQTALVLGGLIYARAQLKDARTDREERDRPFVVVELDGEDDPQQVDIAIRNIGQTIARDITFGFDPPLSSSYDDLGYGVATMKPFTEGIASFSPGQRFRAMFDFAPEREGRGLPESYEVTVAYANHDRSRRWEEKMTLDLGLYRNRVYLGRNGVHELHHEVKAIRETLQRRPTPRPE